MFLPKSLKTLKLGRYTHGVIEPGSLPEGLETFELNGSWREIWEIFVIGSIPSTVRHFVFDSWYWSEWDRNILPANLETLLLYG